MARQPSKNAAKNNAAPIKMAAKKGAALKKYTAKKVAALRMDRRGLPWGWMQPRRGPLPGTTQPRRGVAPERKKPKRKMRLNLISRRISRSGVTLVTAKNSGKYCSSLSQASKDELQKPDVVKKIGDLIEAVEHFSKYGELPAESKHSSKRESFLAKYITGLSRKPDGIHNQDYVHLTKSIEAIMWTPILEMTKPDINNAAAIGLSPIPRVQAHDLLYALDGLLWLGSADNNITEEALEVTKLYLRLLEWGTNGADFTSDTDAASELEEAQGVNEATMEASPLADSPCPDDVYGAPGPNEATMDLGTFDALSCAKLEGGLYASAVTETAMGLDSDAQAVTETSVEKLDPSDVLLGLEGGTGAPGISEAAMYLGTSFDTFLLQLEEEGFDAAIDLDTCNASVLADGDNSWADHPSFEQAWEALEEKY